MSTYKTKLLCLLVVGILLYPGLTFARRVREVITPGSLFKPSITLKPTEEIESLSYLEREILSGRKIRSSEMVGRILQEGGSLEVEAHLRGLDGPGSSLDLPNFQEMLTLPDEPLPSTATLTSDFDVNIEFSKASFDDIDNLPEELENEKPENLIIYSAPDYNIPEEHPYIARPIKRGGKVAEFEVWRWNTKQKKYEKSPLPISEDLPTLSNKLGLAQAPAYIFGRLFCITGIRIHLGEISPMALAGGMESSNAFIVSLLSAASILSGANFSWADIVVTAVLLENKVLGGENSTGGQGHLASILGGAYRHVWLSGREKYYGALSIPLVPKDEFDNFKEFIKNHMLLVQYGKEYKDGKPVGTRAADLTNTMWTDLLVEKDPVGLPLHQEKLGLTEAYVNALKNRNIDTIIKTIQRYVEIRNQLTLRWAEAVIKEGKEEWLTGSEDRKGLPDEYKEALALYGLYGAAYEARKSKLDKLKDAEGNYVDVDTLNQLALDRLEKIYEKKMSFYTAKAQKFVENAKKKGFAFMPLGAGGPGAVMIAVARDLNELKKFLEGWKDNRIKNGINEIKDEDEQEIVNIIRGKKDGKIIGYVPFEISNQDIKFSGLIDNQALIDEYGLKRPEKGEHFNYNQQTGELP